VEELRSSTSLARCDRTTGIGLSDERVHAFVVAGVVTSALSLWYETERLLAAASIFI
jgi:hypothetical protein